MFERQGSCDLSVVIPVYYCYDCLDELHRRLCEQLEDLSFEIIFVNDAGHSKDWPTIKRIANQDERVRGLDLSHNCGQHISIMAGLDVVLGERVVVMDGDLQDSPQDLSRMMAKLDEGNDIVFTFKENRAHYFFKNACARLFEWVNRWLGRRDSYSIEVGSFCMLTRSVVEAYRQVRNRNQHFIMVLKWLGFRQTSIPVVHQNRFAGSSSYSLPKLIRHAINGLTSQSYRLLYGSIAIGFLLMFGAFVYLLVLLGTHFFKYFQEGWMFLMGMILLSTGLILFFIGILGLYLAQVFEHVKEQPLYFVRETL